MGIEANERVYHTAHGRRRRTYFPWWTSVVLTCGLVYIRDTRTYHTLFLVHSFRSSSAPGITFMYVLKRPSVMLDTSLNK